MPRIVTNALLSPKAPRSSKPSLFSHLSFSLFPPTISYIFPRYLFYSHTFYAISFSPILKTGFPMRETPRLSMPLPSPLREKTTPLATSLECISLFVVLPLCFLYPLKIVITLFYYSFSIWEYYGSQAVAQRSECAFCWLQASASSAIQDCCQGG